MEYSSNKCHAIEVGKSKNIIEMGKSQNKPRKPCRMGEENFKVVGEDLWK